MVPELLIHEARFPKTGTNTPHADLITLAFSTKLTRHKSNWALITRIHPLLPYFVLKGFCVPTSKLLKRFSFSESIVFKLYSVI